ncbi:hypothetical protein PINS_up008621 [Pythium insidiosum]|nr:hypothetical protein PINS_up008621 [Pythium insidiosum]
MSFSDQKAQLDAKDLDFLRHLPDLAASVDSSPSTSQPTSPTSHARHDWRQPPHAVPSSASPSSSPSPPLPKRFNWTRRLVVTKQPASEFYKDEGTRPP